MLACLAGPVALAAAPAPVALAPDGIGPFRLGVPLARAARRALPLDPAAAQIGPACDARDQVNVSLSVDGRPLSVMSMAGADGRIEEILATPHDGTTAAADAGDCRARGEALAHALAPRLGPIRARETVRKPVSDEFLFQFAGDARVLARWFAGGRSCDLALQFGAPSAPLP
ncbi:MAG: hypothetical protein GX576_08210 [Thauera phenolivorans]|uniref:Uncharacterized protein n=1 Tax=Thauera phenolivorans TaxID=1792543 RepID=A0A7X7LW01_9RHOO|nr:hypothetical protein [Thauera phenolivorans]NLF54360.1 hypothetical protein [Thauera phenolivorans]